MSISSGQKPYADTLFKYLPTKSLVKFLDVYQGNTFTGEDKSYDSRFWIRSKASLYEANAWNAGTTYATGDKVSSGGKVYESLQDSNLNNSVTNTNFWEYLWTLGSKTGGWINLQVGINSRGGGKSSYTLYKWNEGTAVWDVLDSGNVTNNIDQVHSFSLEPGRYRLKGKAESIPVWLGNGWVTAHHRQADNTMVAGDKIRAMRTDFSDLRPFGSTLMTSQLARDGYLSHIGYEGGTEEGD